MPCNVLRMLYVTELRKPLCPSVLLWLVNMPEATGSQQDSANHDFVHLRQGLTCEFTPLRVYTLRPLQ